MNRLATAAACLLGLAACEFDRADQEPTQQTNSCSVTADCSGGAECTSGLCVAPSGAAELDIALQVTPLPGRNSATPHPVLIEGLKIKGGPVVRPVSLPPSITVSGSIRNNDSAIDASLSFTPVHTLRGIAPASVTASTTREGIDYRVELSAGVEYTVLVRPSDTTLPSWRTTFRAIDSEGVNVDFADLPTRSQTYLLEPLKDRVLLVQAFDSSNQPISSTAVVEREAQIVLPVLTPRRVAATLVFAGDSVPYRLEIRAQQSYEPTTQEMAEGAFCDDDTPAYPVYSIADSELGEPDADGAIELELPETPARIRYQGTIALCAPGAEAIMTQAAPQELPVYLHSKNVLAEEGAYSASFEANTMAQFDGATHEFTFCVQLMEGDYDVVVTPPTNLPCAVYAQHLTIDAPDAMAARGMLLTLPKSGSLQGTLLTLDEMPLAGVAVDAVALGRTIKLHDDPTLTRYNRSRQAITSERGKFSIPVDLGSYDVLIKPPASSGFSWQVLHDVGVGSARDFLRTVDMTSPVMLSGRLEMSGTDQAMLAGAEVLAYAVIAEEPPIGGDVAVIGKRAVAIGKATADADGVFMLLLPQTLTPEW